MIIDRNNQRETLCSQGPLAEPATQQTVNRHDIKSERERETGEARAFATKLRSRGNPCIIVVAICQARSRGLSVDFDLAKISQRHKQSTRVYGRKEENSMEGESSRWPVRVNWGEKVCPQKATRAAAVIYRGISVAEPLASVPGTPGVNRFPFPLFAPPNDTSFVITTQLQPSGYYNRMKVA